MNERFVLIKPHLTAAHVQATAQLGCPQHAADIIQQVVERALKTAHFPQQTAAVKAWFLKAIHNAGIDALRRMGKQQPVDQHIIDSFSDASVPTPPELCAQQQLRHQVNQALANLPFEQREILVMRELNGCSYADIALVLDVELGTVMSRLHRARQALRHALHDIYPTPYQPNPIQLNTSEVMQ